MMDRVRKLLQNTDGRRKSVRVPTDLPVTIFPIYGDGTVLRAVAGRCRDVSAEGVRFVAESPIGTAYVFVGFGDATGGWCVLTRLLRNRQLPDGSEHAGRFRLDL